MPKIETPPTHLDMAENLVSFGRKNGADEVEVTIVDGSEFSVDIRQGEIENLVEASARSLSLKVIKDQKTAYASSSDLSTESLHKLISSAVNRAELSSTDRYAGHPLIRRLTTISMP